MAYLEHAAVFEQLDALNMRAAALQIRRSQSQELLAVLRRQHADTEVTLNSPQRAGHLSELRAKLKIQEAENARMDADYMRAVGEIETFLIRVEEAVSNPDSMALMLKTLEIEVSASSIKHFAISGAAEIKTAFYAEVEARGKLHRQRGVPIIGVKSDEAQDILRQVAASKGLVMRPVVSLEFDKDRSTGQWLIVELFAVGNEVEVKRELVGQSELLARLHASSLLSQDGKHQLNEGLLHLKGDNLVRFQVGCPRDELCKVVAEGKFREEDEQYQAVRAVHRCIEPPLICETELPDILQAARKCLHEVSGSLKVLNAWDRKTLPQNVEQVVTQRLKATRVALLFAPILVAVAMIACFSLIAAVSAFVLVAISMVIFQVEILDRIDVRLKKKWMENDGGRYAFTTLICDEYELPPQDVTLGMMHTIIRSYVRVLVSRVRNGYYHLAQKAAQQAISRVADTSRIINRNELSTVDYCVGSDHAAARRENSRDSTCRQTFKSIVNSEFATPSTTLTFDQNFDSTTEINPATGLPMISDFVDVSGNAYGTSGMDALWCNVEAESYNNSCGGTGFSGMNSGGFGGDFGASNDMF